MKAIFLRPALWEEILSAWKSVSETKKWQLKIGASKILNHPTYWNYYHKYGEVPKKTVDDRDQTTFSEKLYRILKEDSEGNAFALINISFPMPDDNNHPDCQIIKDYFLFEIWFYCNNPDDPDGILEKRLLNELDQFIFAFVKQVNHLGTARIMKEIMKNNPDGILDRSIDDLDLTVRAHRSLKNGNVKTVRALIGLSEKDLKELSCFSQLGKQQIQLIKQLLAEMGLLFRDDKGPLN